MPGRPPSNRVRVLNFMQLAKLLLACRTKKIKKKIKTMAIFADFFPLLLDDYCALVNCCVYQVVVSWFSSCNYAIVTFLKKISFGSFIFLESFFCSHLIK